jgi:hypothetical protein
MTDKYMCSKSSTIQEFFTRWVPCSIYASHSRDCPLRKLTAQSRILRLRDKFSTAIDADITSKKQHPS